MTAISVLIRTIGRQTALKDALDSLAAQSFRDFEVVVVEDGPATLAEFLAFYSFSSRAEAGRGAEDATMSGGRPHPNLSPIREGMSICYKALDANAGRSAAGNRALALAKGEYCLFLDEDDLLYPDHLHYLHEGVKQSGSGVAYSWSEERRVERDAQGTILRTGKWKRRRRERFSLLQLIAGNYLPINAVLFSRTLYKRAGGFDEDMNCLEDWLLWLRFAAIEPRFHCVPRVTAVYHTSLDVAARRLTFRPWREKIRERLAGIQPIWPLAVLERELQERFYWPLFLCKLYYHVTSYLPF